MDQQRSSPIYHWEGLRGKSAFGSLSKETSLFTNPPNQHKQLFPPTSNFLDSLPPIFSKEHSQTKNLKYDQNIEVKTCQCASCQELKDKPAVQYGPTIMNYLDQLPVSLKIIDI